MTTWIALATPFADTWGMHGNDGGPGWWIAMALVMVLLLGVLIAILLSVLRSDARGNVPHPAAGPSAREILDRRLADGSIDADEYERRRRLLE